MSTVGANINELERLVAENIGCKYAVALSAGTASLHLASNAMEGYEFLTYLPLLIENTIRNRFDYASKRKLLKVLTLSMGFVVFTSIIYYILNPGIFCSQYVFEEWYDQLGGEASPLADAIIDRIAHDSYQINITSIDAEHDKSMREVYGLDKSLRE